MHHLFRLKHALLVMTAAAVLLVACPAMAESYEQKNEGEVSVYGIHATTKYVPGKTDEMVIPPEVFLEGLRGEWVSFQILIKLGYNVASLEDVNVIPSKLMLDGSEKFIDVTAFDFYREWFFDIKANSGGGREVPNHLRRPGLYPDPLIPFKDPFKPGDVPVAAPFSLEKNPGFALIWVDLFIPRDAAPGLYRGSIDFTWRAFSANGQQAETPMPSVDVNLQVWDLDMPHERNIGTSYGMHNWLLRRYHGGPDPDAPSANFDEIVRTYHKVLHQHRMDLTYQKGPVEFKFDDDGELLPVDWTAYDAHMQPRIDGTYFDDTVGVTRFASGMFEPGGGTGSMTEDQYKAAARAFVEHLDEKGWLHRMWTYSTDEPWLNGGDETWARVIHDAGLLHEASDLWKGRVLVTGPMYRGAEDVVDIWCPVTPMYGDWFWLESDYAGRGDYDEHMANGGELWFYNCNANFPPFAGYDIDTTIGYEPRILKWGAWFEKATGFLYWHTNYWSQAGPWVEWQSIANFDVLFARNGDGLLWYPGDSDGYHVDNEGNPIPSGVPEWLSIDGPITSYRMKQIRDGLEDWELFIMADKAGLGDWLRTEIGRAYTKFGTPFYEDCSIEGAYCPAKGEPWTLDENVLLDVRKRVASKLQFTLHPDKYKDPDEPDEPDEEPLPNEDIIATPEDCIEPGEVTDEDAAETPVDAKDAETPVDAKTDDLKTSSKSGCSASGSSSLPGAILLALLSGLLLIRRRNRA